MTLIFFSMTSRSSFMMSKFLILASKSLSMSSIFFKLTLLPPVMTYKYLNLTSESIMSKLFFLIIWICFEYPNTLKKSIWIIKYNILHMMSIFFYLASISLIMISKFFNLTSKSFFFTTSSKLFNLTSKSEPWRQHSLNWH